MATKATFGPGRKPLQRVAELKDANSCMFLMLGFGTWVALGVDVGREVPVNSLSKVIAPIHSLGRRFLQLRPIQHAAGSRLGLALSGGFARGIAHIGVLKVLEEFGIPVSYIAGSSVGAMVGALYCSGVSASEMEEIACCARRHHFARLSISRYGLLSNRRMTRFLERVLKATHFEQLQLPLAITATELATGEAVILRSGSLAQAVRASCAYPGLFTPVEVNNQLLVDGAITHPVPVEPLRELNPDCVIAVNLRTRSGLGGPRNMFDILAKSFAIAQERSGNGWRAQADVVVEPDVRRFRPDDFGQARALIAAGESAMREALPALLPWFAAEIQPPAIQPSAPVLAPTES